MHATFGDRPSFNFDADSFAVFCKYQITPKYKTIILGVLKKGLLDKDAFFGHSIIYIAHSSYMLVVTVSPWVR